MADDPSNARSPNVVDLHVGARMRTRRKLAGVSQERLAADLKLTFQQVQKYERGANRISASKLYEAAKALQVPVAYFFEGLADPVGGVADSASVTADRIVGGLLNTPEGLDLAHNFVRIGRGRLRRQVLALVRVMADDDAL